MTKLLVAKWFIGAVVGTALVAVSSPLFVRSYVPSRIDSLRQVVVPANGHQYRWRSEGYATTRIGPHGMPGLEQLPAQKKPSEIRLAIWGDSQAEGVSVEDRFKLHSQIEPLARTEQLNVVALPLARSGDDLGDWLAQIPRVEEPLGVDAHVLFIAELSDLTDFVPVAINKSTLVTQNQLASTVPSFVIQAARNALQHPDGTQKRFRFSLGPVRRSEPRLVPALVKEVDGDLWHQVAERIRLATGKDVYIVYAPVLPAIVTSGAHVPKSRIERADLNDQSFRKLRQSAMEFAINVIDVRPDLIASADANRWPHGFHNGRIGEGHLNATGYRVVAKKIVNELANPPAR
ncbi:hypothetical protein CA13_07780 [Planctomycetes bacterium CA13]|uniref:Uncharacterized protein n=1 Tax=Novipirellula herctigrandis TaxID=2527986 RepID=A0A5C5YWH8_9BACT|nr:hypothetical protein CA13_07780 [Planctomycetes bacterium CA13]